MQFRGLKVIGIVTVSLWCVSTLTFADEAVDDGRQEEEMPDSGPSTVHQQERSHEDGSRRAGMEGVDFQESAKGKDDYSGNMEELNKNSEIFNDNFEGNTIGKRSANLQDTLPELFDQESKKAFSSWGGKRARFSNWGGKRDNLLTNDDTYAEEPDKRGKFNSCGGKRKFNSWGGKRSETPTLSCAVCDDDLREDTNYQKRRTFQSWGGKRDGDEEVESQPDEGKRSFHSWGGKREGELRNAYLTLRPGFEKYLNWGGKRKFSSWGGKRSGFDTPLINPYEEKRATEFKQKNLFEKLKSFINEGSEVNSQRSNPVKRGMGFNSWGGKRSLFFPWGG